MGDRLTLGLLAILLLSQLGLLASSPASEGGRFERLALAAFYPVIDATASIRTLGERVSGSLRRERGLREENRRLVDELDRARRELARLTSIDEELDRLSRLSGYRKRTAAQIQVADVVYLTLAGRTPTMVIDLGTVGAVPDQPVISDAGLVGRVVRVVGRYARVQLIIDRTASVSAMLERTRRKGIARGNGGPLLDLDYIPARSEVAAGDRIATAGIDGLFPRGLSLGQVVRVAEGSELFRAIEVEPSVDFGTVDQVYLLAVETLPPELRRTLSDDVP